MVGFGEGMGDYGDNTHEDSNNNKSSADNKYADRLSKRLCYLLRYGALRNGLVVHEGGK